MKVIIRDDDISYFTPAALLEQLYEPLWNQGMPVCLSVIPNHYDSVMVPSRSGALEPDENTPRCEFGRDITHPVGKNSRLTNLLSSLENDGCVEICVHGLEHRHREFDVDAFRARELLASSLEILFTAFPKTNPTTFVPPYDVISREALQLLTEHKFNVVTAFDTLRDLKLVARENQEDCIIELNDDSVVFACANYLFDSLNSERKVEQTLDDVLRRDAKLLIIVNHYWAFFDDFIRPKRGRIELWKNFVRALIGRGDNFTTFRQEALGFNHSYT